MKFGRFLSLAFVLIALANSGCLMVAAGAAAAAGGAAGYAYYTGKICYTYNADATSTVAAARSAITDLGMAVTAEESSTDGGILESRTSDGETVRVVVGSPDNRNLAVGPVTQVCVRVGTFGDHPLSHRILEQVGSHLVSGSPNQPLTPIAQNATPAPPLANPLPQTGPPPLLQSDNVSR